MTWYTRPPLGPEIGDDGPVAPGDAVSFDVSLAVVAGSTAVFALASTGADGTHFSSKEDGDGSNAPLLVVTTGEPTTDDGPELSGAGDDTPAGTGAPMDFGGCGCGSRVPGDRPGPRLRPGAPPSS